MPQDLTIHDYAGFDTKARAEGIPKPTLHWLKDGKQIKLDDTNFKVDFGSATNEQVSSDFSIGHFSKQYEGTVSKFGTKFEALLSNNFLTHCLLSYGSTQLLRQILPVKQRASSVCRCCKQFQHSFGNWIEQPKSHKASHWS